MSGYPLLARSSLDRTACNSTLFTKAQTLLEREIITVNDSNFPLKTTNWTCGCLVHVPRYLGLFIIEWLLLEPCPVIFPGLPVGIKDQATASFDVHHQLLL